MNPRPDRFGKCFEGGIQRAENTTMSHNIADLLVTVAHGYLILGILFAMVFVTWGVNRIDPLAPAAPWTFRVLVTPGTVVFWPLLLVRWLTGSVAPPVETNPHRLRARRRS
jgi:hypothetical protein